LFEELALAHADGSYTTRLARIDVLVLDDRDWRRSKTRSARICSKCSRIETTAARR
jgi:hypothetical protein